MALRARLEVTVSLPVLALAALAAGCDPVAATSDAGLDASAELDALRPADAPAPSDTARTDAPRVSAPPLTCAEGSGAPIELLPIARLAADGTDRAVRGQVREDRDGPMALRNEVDDDGWLAAGGLVARLEIDLGPALGAAVPIDAVTMTLASRPERVAVLVMDACGGRVVRAAEDVDPSAPIALDGACGSCVVVEIESPDDTRMMALSVTSRAELALPSFEPDATGPFEIRFPSSGVVEGFYGRPWSFAERRRMIARLAELGMGLYLYAPKDDPLHRDRWREPYDEAFLASFRELGALADRTGVRLIFGVSPFLDMDPDSAADRAALVAKVRAFLDAGADGVAILADDIELGADVTVDGALGEAHVRVTEHVRTEVRASHPEAVLLFVPTVYNDLQLDGHGGAPDYLRALPALSADVEILWTGTAVGSDTLRGAELDRARSLIGRRLLVWDNLWSNDIADPFGGQMMLTTYAGRDAALRHATTGVLANPLIQGAAARIAVGHLGAWLSDGAIDGAARIASGTAEERLSLTTPAGSRGTLAFVAETFDGSFVREPTHRRATAAFEAVVAAAVGGRAPDEADLRDAFTLLARIAALPSEVRHSSMEPGLVDQLEAPVAQASASAWEGLMALLLLEARSDGVGVEEAESALEEASRVRASASRFRWGDGAIARGVHAVRTTASAHLPTAAPARGILSLIPECVVGSPIFVTPFAVRIETVNGLPGASPLDELEWTPRHPGRHVAIFTGSTREAPSGWAVARYELSCVPAR